MIRKLWTKWKALGQFMGDLLARVVLSFFYFTLLVPFAIGTRLFSDRVGLKTAPLNNWHQRKALEDTIELAREQS